jgi:hypothetical protein
MKRSLCVIALLCLLAPPTMAASVTFAWDYPTPMPSGFEMTVTPAVGAPIIFDCGPSAAKTCTVSGLAEGSYTAFVRAYNVGSPEVLKGYSDRSNVIALTVPAKPSAPSNNRIVAAIMAGIGAIGILIWALIRKLK